MSTCSTAPFNYACHFGIHSVAAAIVFAVLYVPLLIWHTMQAVFRPTYVYIVLSFFCTIRVVAFVTRAILAASDSAGENVDFFIANSIIYSIGFFGLLYSSYTLVLDRDLISDPTRKEGIITRLTRDRRLFRLALTIAVVLGITGTTYSFGSHPKPLGITLRKASIVIFLVLTALLALQTIRLARQESHYQSNNREAQSFVEREGAHILLLVCILLLAREAFFTATMNKIVSEKVWYPLAAVTELLAVCLLAIRGLVPPRSDLPQ